MLKKYCMFVALGATMQALVAGMPPTMDNEEQVIAPEEQIIAPSSLSNADTIQTFDSAPIQTEDSQEGLSDSSLMSNEEEVSTDENKDDSGLTSAEIAALTTGAVAATALGAAAVVGGKTTYDRKKAASQAAVEAPRTQIPTPPVGDQYRKQTPPPPVAPRVRPVNPLERVQRLGVNVSPLNPDAKPAQSVRPTPPPKPAYMQPRVNVEPEDRVIKGFDPEKAAKGTLSGAEKITVHQTVPGSQPAEQKRSTFGSWMRGRR